LLKKNKNQCKKTLKAAKGKSQITCKATVILTIDFWMNTVEIRRVGIALKN
jgi:hypothetical protein